MSFSRAMPALLFRLLILTALALGLTGCSVFVPSKPDPARGSLHQPLPPKKQAKPQPSGLASWLGPQEPAKPKTVREWMKQNKQMRLPGQVEE